MTATTEQISPGIANTEKLPGFVVGIGASAGGLGALEALFSNVDRNDSSAFIVVQHMPPDTESSLTEILGRYTPLKVVAIEDGMELATGSVFVIQPGTEIKLEGRKFVVSKRDRESYSRPVDALFHSLGYSFGANAIAIILSGTGSDGSEGIRDVHSTGGVTVAQTPSSAQFDGMPRNAIATECVDFVLPPKSIATWLNEQFNNPDKRMKPDPDIDTETLTGIGLIFSLLSKRHEIDFKHYKPSTVARRIDRRKQLAHCTSLTDFAEMIKDNVEELDLLYHDLLIGVTKFFRDTEAFRALESLVATRVKNLDKQEEFRVWTAGCATGEEAYTVAMIVHEAFVKANKEPRYKIFATDAHSGALEAASRAVYDRESMEFVNQLMRSRYFVEDDHGMFRVKSDLRCHLVFARHNVIQDPPFTKLDLVTCRNMLIYFQPSAQHNTISTIHFGLKADGLMMLGASETPGKLSQLFTTIDESWRIYAKRGKATPLANTWAGQRNMSSSPRRLINMLNNDRPESMSFTSLIDAYGLILAQFVEAGLLLDEHRNVLHIFGDANRYLQSGSGRFTGNLLGFLSGEPRVAIAAALIRASREVGRKVVLEDVELAAGQETERVDVLIRAMIQPETRALMWFVEFRDTQVSSEDDRERVQQDEEDEIRVDRSGDDYAVLESELLYTKESLSATIQELEAANEELQATNEELLASNEEMQSTNEELHSVNEELYSVNAENQRKIVALEEVTDDIDNLLANTDIGTIFLDLDLKIRRFTHAAQRYIKLVPSDVGRKLTDFALRITIADLYEKIDKVTESGEALSEEYCSENGERTILRIVPYFSGNQVNGSIVNFVDATDIRASEQV